MGSLILAFLAAGCAALSNLFFRKNSDNSAVKNANGYLVLLYLFSFIASLLFYPDIFNVTPNFTMIILGGCVGILNVLLMLLTARALQKGPAGLTFAFQNVSAVFPGLLLFLIFGNEFGFSSSYFQWIGITCVLVGLFLGAKKASNNDSRASFKWLKYVIACLLVQIFALSFIQGRCVLFNCDQAEGFLSALSLEGNEDVWFMPGLFGTALFLQTLLFLKERRKLHPNEIIFGSLAGFANFGSTGLLLLATKFAMPFEKGILLPCFSVATIILCNIWANRLYREKFNLTANSISATGIFIGILE